MQQTLFGKARHAISSLTREECVTRLTSLASGCLDNIRRALLKKLIEKLTSTLGYVRENAVQCFPKVNNIILIIK